jgi:hypothetical protein
VANGEEANGDWRIAIGSSQVSQGKFQWLGLKKGLFEIASCSLSLACNFSKLTKLFDLQVNWWKGRRRRGLAQSKSQPKTSTSFQVEPAKSQFSVFLLSPLPCFSPPKFCMAGKIFAVKEKERK